MRKLLLILLLPTLVLAAQAPLFQLEDTSGNDVKLSDYLGENVVLLDFWATSCAPCLAVMPHIQELHEKYEDDGLKVIGISEDLPRNLSSVKAKARELGVTYTIVLDKNAAALQAYQGGDTGIPFIVIIDSSGAICETFRRIQPGDEDKIESAVRDALGL